MSAATDELRSLLAGVTPGAIPRRHPVENLLMQAWAEFDGNDWHATKGDKLPGRIENTRWEPPLLRFLLERHGGTVNGSSRGKLHHWAVDVNAQTARVEKVGARQLKPLAKKLDVKPIAEEIARAIKTVNAADGRLKWIAAGRTVRVEIAALYV